MFRSGASVFRRISPGLIRCRPAQALTRASQHPVRNGFGLPLARPLGLRILHSANCALWEVDKNRVKQVAKQKPISEKSKSPPEHPDKPESLKKDINIIVDTVALRTVPREAYLLGLAGTLPYLATSLTTLYLGWDLRQTWAPSVKSWLMFTHENAQQLLAFIEPVQLGYGAVIISFLGAIHWGMQFNERNPTKECTRFRYTMGVISPAIAWPSLMMPFEYALMSQMVAFTLLYFADTKASTKGWAPAWYGTYRFMLTFVVCAAIVLSLIGRQNVALTSSVLADYQMGTKADTKEERKENESEDQNKENK